MLKLIEKITKKDSRLAAGLMSGTSLDGLDVAICEITGFGEEVKLKLLYFKTHDYTEDFRKRLLRVCSKDTSSVEEVCALNKELGIFSGKAVAETMKELGMSLDKLDFIASHGQTIYHMPGIGATLQIGEGADIAAITGVPVVSDFRVSDMAYGGQGAPLAPFFDFRMCRDLELSRVLINTGGIANLTYVPPKNSPNEVMAFDTGPANVVSDNLIKIKTEGNETYDKDGKYALSGKVCSALLEQMIESDPFLKLAPPKTTGRELYTLEYAKNLLDTGAKMGLPFEDIVRTAIEFSAFCISYNVENFIGSPVDEYYLSGGGFHNPALKGALEERLHKPMKPLEDLGFSGDAKEAAFFALLGNEFLNYQFNNVKSVTGADRNVVMGKLSLPSPGPVIHLS